MTDPVFFVPSRRYTAAEIANLTGAELVDPSAFRHRDRRIASATEGGEGMLVFVEGKRNAAPAANAQRRRRALHRRNRGQGAAGRRDPGARTTPQAAFAMIGRLLFPAAASPRR